MTFNVYAFRGVEQTEKDETFIDEFSTPQEVTTFVQAWMNENDFNESSITWIGEKMGWEALDSRPVRDTAVFKLIRYADHSNGWYGLKIVQINTESEPEE